MSRADNLGVRTVSRNTLFPSRSQEPISLPLSILDAKVANFAPAAAFWVYERHDLFSPDKLRTSLRETLNLYPHFTGELSFVENVNYQDHSYRPRRLQVKYGFPTDPGLVFVVAESEVSIQSLIPDNQSLSDGWDASQLPSSPFIPADPLPPSATGASAVIIQVTHFPDAVGIGIRLAHGLSDAHTLVQFKHNWASIHRQSSIPYPPVIDPLLLNRAAAGNIDANAPEDVILQVSADLPILRYDYWASADGCPPFMSDSTIIPPELSKKPIKPLGVPMPWNEWDASAPASHYVVHFTPSEVHHIWLAASSPSDAPLGPRLSHLDSLLAFAWILINRARGMASSPRPVHLITSLGMRGRLVPSNFVGSPIVLASVTCVGQEESLQTVAGSIRAVIERFTPGALGALLHDMAYEDTPQRVWNGFLGQRHVIFTSWLRLGMNEVQFVDGVKPVYATSVMPPVDGVLQITEGRASAQEVESEGAGRKAVGWWANGVDVSFELNAETMQALLKDPILRNYRYGFDSLCNVIAVRYGSTELF